MAFNAKPKLLYDSILVGATLAATDTASGYDVDNITDLRPYTLHKFDDYGTKYITIDCGSVDDVLANINLKTLANRLYAAGLLDRDLDEWTSANSPTLSQDEIGIDGVQNTAWTFEDDNGSGTAAIYLDETIADDTNTHVFFVPVKKDSDETSYPAIALELRDGTTTKYRAIAINKKTGAHIESADCTVGVEDIGNYWLVWIAVTNNSTGNTTARRILYPAFRVTDLSSIVPEISATGSAVFDSPIFQQNRSEPSLAIASAIGIVGHNLGTADATVSVEYSLNGTDWTSLTSFRQFDDTALMKEFTVTAARYWRIGFVTSATAAQLGVAMLGQPLTFPRWPKSEFDPDALTISASSEVSKSGNPLGATLKYVTRKISMNFENITPAWMTGVFKAAWDNHFELLKPFFIAWDITNHPSEVYFLSIPESFSLKMPYNPYRRTLKLTFQGAKE